MDHPLNSQQRLRPLLVKLRKQARLSQAAVASKLGITQQSYAKIEANPEATSVGRLFDILRLLGVELVFKNPNGENEELSHACAPESDQAGSTQAKPSTPPDKNAEESDPPKMGHSTERIGWWPISDKIRTAKS